MKTTTTTGTETVTTMTTITITITTATNPINWRALLISVTLPSPVNIEKVVVLPAPFTPKSARPMNKYKG